MVATKVGLDQLAVASTTGTKTWTEASIGTPKAALFFGSVGTTLGTIRDLMSLSVGVVDTASDDYANSIQSRHNFGSSNCFSGNVFYRSIRYGTQIGNRDGHLNLNAFGVDDVDMNVGNTTSSDYHTTGALFVCAEANVVWWSGGAISDQDVDTVAHGLTGGAPDCVIALTSHERAYSVSDPYGGADDARFTIGFIGNANSTITQAAQGFGETHNQAAGGNPEARVSATRFLTSPQGKGSFECTALDSTNLTMKYHSHSDNVDPSALIFLFLRFDDGAEAQVGVYDTPTTAISDSESGLDVEPDFLFLLQNNVATLDTDVTNAGAGAWGMGAANDSNEFCSSIQVEDAADPTDTSSLNDNQIVNLPKDTAATGYAATLTSLDSDGFTLNFSAAHGTSHKWPYLVIGQPAAAGGDVLKDPIMRGIVPFAR